MTTDSLTSVLPFTPYGAATPNYAYFRVSDSDKDYEMQQHTDLYTLKQTANDRSRCPKRKLSDEAVGYRRVRLRPLNLGQEGKRKPEADPRVLHNTGPRRATITGLMENPALSVSNESHLSAYRPPKQLLCRRMARQMQLSKTIESAKNTNCALATQSCKHS
ncbi:hypothetical protein PGT21_015903 [Puccinia graminis f. sp. tritici]|uniref:Uncharacterized protein n=1 Tax=Puccinia graminis f. sp. tritici TaxID=56615 RepID=A0A5B0MRI2_PUCGR|nr:hypothetical protein PGT21_015903 [Puccinia graminis f. sp. tritici]